MSNKNNLAKVYHFDLYGKREDKYEFLNENSLDTIEWNELAAEEPNFFFVKKNFEGAGEYEKGFKIDELFIFNGAGVQTKRDNLFIDFDKTNLIDRIRRLLNNSLSDKEKADLNIKNSSSFRLLEKINASTYQEHFIKKYNYRVFDDRNIYYDRNLLGRAFYNIMKNILEDNIGIIVCKQQSTFDFQHSFITKNLTDHNSISLQTQEASFLFPLYLYPETSGQQSTEQTTSPVPPKEGYSQRKPNLNPAIVQEIADRLGLEFVNEKTSPTPPKEGLSQPGYVTANPKTYKLIKEMRDSLKDNPTEAEKVMWEYLRNKKTGYKIRRQHIIDDFITDFVCLRKKVVIEIDGKIHLLQKEYDELRTAKLNELDYEVIRFTNEDVFTNPELVASKIKQKLDSKIDFLSDDILNSPPLEGLGEVFAPIDILDYIYAVLHSPTYREKYKEFLKIDFPRVPYPKAPSPSERAGGEVFWQLVKLGGELRQIHLLESAVVEKPITQYPIGGDNVITKISFSLSPKTNLETPLNHHKGETSEDWSSSSPLGRLGGVLNSGGVLTPAGNVYINETQYFGNVPEIAWNFYIGGYQPAQKWLKDRKGRELQTEDIFHYQKIIVALTETDRIMKEIDEIEIE